MSTDRIEKKVLLRATRSRVWRAIVDPRELGAWFGMEVEGTFAPGTAVVATIKPTTVDPEVAKQQQAWAGTRFRMFIEQIEPERLFSFRWHPSAVGLDVDPAEPTTLVTFELADAPDGVLLTITESGFDRIPLARRAKAFADNEQGWSMQVQLIGKYLAR